MSPIRSSAAVTMRPPLTKSRLPSRTTLTSAKTTPTRPRQPYGRQPRRGLAGLVADTELVQSGGLRRVLSSRHGQGRQRRCAHLHRTEGYARAPDGVRYAPACATVWLSFVLLAA